MEFITNSLLFQKRLKIHDGCQSCKWLQLQNCSFCIINYFETSSTAIDTPKFLILVWIFVDDDNGDNEMIM